MTPGVDDRFGVKYLDRKINFSGIDSEFEDEI
jgi:hypothetical protein